VWRIAEQHGAMMARARSPVWAVRDVRRVREPLRLVSDSQCPMRIPMLFALVPRAMPAAALSRARVGP